MNYSEEKKQQLESILANYQMSTYPNHSRIHPLNNFSTTNCYVKREDELGFGISGSKIRKYRSLIPFLKKNHYTEVVVIGSSQSNNVLGIIQLLIENQIKPTLFLKKPSSNKVQGNFLLIQLLVEKKTYHFISQEDWENVEALAHDYLNNNSARKIFILKEGASVKESLPGSLSLPLDILINERENGIEFDHLFVDSGTGMMACALAIAFQFILKKTTIHVLLCAANEDYFLKQLQNFHHVFIEMFQLKCDYPTNFILHKPISSPSFGGTNTEIFREIKNIARNHGILTDPIYTAKLFLESRRIIEEQGIEGNVLINHSGGALTLAGFSSYLEKQIDTTAG
ncbi:MAG: pyridoxal-phosphate dependent enzyme [Parachlamydiaceae bacterium]|nr:pyridoxal-phosphate dependent enzyme [Parachlamydiaceae bacterium]